MFPHFPSLFPGTHTNTQRTTTTLRGAPPPPQGAQGAPPARANDGGRPALEFDLDALQERHQADKEKAALIRQNIQGQSVAS